MEQEYKKILVGVDGSDEAEKAFTKAVQVAIRNKAELVIVNIIDSRAFQGISGFENVIADDTLKSAKEFVDRYEKIAHDAGVENTKTRIEFGSPKVLLSDTVPREEGVDLIMVGSTGLTAIERLLIGSVAEYIIRNAPCDVLVVR
ncbi:universal stress protein [Floricoccus penangensis]|uniref:Universal stress protein n=1 Tax=Floricoccus penangensis TaxID=1859475 RepID=A0A9Q5P0K6_9LACT|nr:universal stress protein [Floricoccus penangensis]OFI47086.1 universal stress protein UspA [Floricoccus penangensis]URZ87746.1 universal stress protein [Floricoccus penangensis]